MKLRPKPHSWKYNGPTMADSMPVIFGLILAWVVAWLIPLALFILFT